MQDEAAAPVCTALIDTGPHQRLADATALGVRGHCEHPETRGVLVSPLRVLITSVGYIGNGAQHPAIAVHGDQYLGYFGSAAGIEEVGLVIGLGVVVRQRAVGSEHEFPDCLIFAGTNPADCQLHIAPIQAGPAGPARDGPGGAWA